MGDHPDHHWHLISYDVRDDGRRRKVARLLEGYGERLQYSVFRLHAGNRQVQRVRWEVARLMADEDDLLCIPLPDTVARGIQTLRGPAEWAAEARPSYVLVG